MENFYKQCHIGTGDYSVWVTIKFKDGTLSITGVESPLRNGNCRGGCGQISTYLNPCGFQTFSNGWDAVKVAKLKNIWDEWHLNDARAGSPNQTLLLGIMEEIEKPSNLDYYHWACEKLKKAGIYEDPEHIVDGKPYRYGSKWLFEEVPDDVLQFLRDLPDSEYSHPWGETG